METAAHKHPNYILIWAYLAILTAAELTFAFKVPVSVNVKIILLLFLAVWKAVLVAMFFMHLKFEPRKLLIIATVPLPLAAIFMLAAMSEHVW